MRMLHLFKARPKRSTKVDSQAEESRSEPQANATVPTTPRPKPKAQPKSNAQPVPMISPPKAEAKPPEQKKGGKGNGKGKRGRSESRPERRKQQCIYFFRGSCQRGDQCRYEHQVGDDGQPVPVAPEIIQRFDDAVKRYSETRAQAKPKLAPRGGVSSSMLVLEIDDLEHGIVLSAAQALDNDEFYAVVELAGRARHPEVPRHPV